ncbi:MAG: AMP-binding protein, partial [Polaromonas sp.]|uniref:AMP-binding protein n=1 Tax=Polaromonas sp. TaxID=1869339 RepID=UPI004034FA83
HRAGGGGWPHPARAGARRVAPVSGDRLFAALAARAPEAVVLRGPARAWSARAVLDEVAVLAARLEGRRVLAVLADNSPAWVMADLAALQTGTVHLPLPAFFSAAQLAHVLTQTGADTLLTDQPEKILALGLGFVAEAPWNGLSWLSRTTTAVQLPAGTAKISFTSGSTGTPKGACLTAAGLLATAAGLTRRLSGLNVTRHLVILPLALLLENTAGIYAPLLQGAEMVLPGLATLGWRGMAGFDPAALQQAVASAAPQSLILVPELLKAWTLLLQATDQRAPPTLAFAAVGGARVDRGLLMQARALGIPAYEGYGLTECGSVVCLNVPGDEGPGVGRPLPHVRLHIEDGEVRIATGAFLGYVEPAQSGRRTGPDGVFATGDLGEIDAQGHLRLSGRRKNLLITSFGRNISPEWVESVLLAQTAVAQAAVTGDARPWLAAVLVPARGATLADLQAAVARANSSLPDYARIGSFITAPPFTPDNGQATGNGRPVRGAISTQHAAALAALYATEDKPHAFL